MKKILMAVLSALIIIQLFVPISGTIKKFNILKTGTEFKFKVLPVDPYDAFRGRYVSLNARQRSNGFGKYGVIALDKDGFAEIVSVSDSKPTSGHYVKSIERGWFKLPIDRYYMDEKLAPKAERLTQRREADTEAYVTVRVKNGNLVVSGLYIDGTAIEDIIRQEMR